MKLFNLKLFMKMSNRYVVKRNFALNCLGTSAPHLQLMMNHQRPLISHKCDAIAQHPPSFVSRSAVSAYGIFSRITGFSSLEDRRNSDALAFALYRLTDHIDNKLFYSYFDLPDTFNSWFLVLELHVWMLLVLLVQRDRKGIHIRNAAVQHFWTDVERRLKFLGKVNAFTVRKQLKELNDTFIVSLWVYDDGIFGTDVNLAGALWYKFFDKKCNDPRKLEVLVRYVRHQVQHMSSLNIPNAESVEKLTNIWTPLSTHIKAVEECP